MAPLDPKAYRRDPACRRMRAELHAVQVGLFGPEKSATPTGAILGVSNYAKAPPEVKYVNDVNTQVQALIRIIESADTELALIEKDLRRAMPALEAITKKLAPVAKAGAHDDLATDLPGGAARPRAAATAPASAPAAGSGAAGAADLPAVAPAAVAPAADIPAAPAAIAPAAVAPAAVNPLDIPPK